MKFPPRKQLLAQKKKVSLQPNAALQSQYKPPFLGPCQSVQGFKIQKNIQSGNQFTPPTSCWSAHRLSAHWTVECFATTFNSICVRPRPRGNEVRKPGDSRKQVWLGKKRIAHGDLQPYVKLDRNESTKTGHSLGKAENIQ